MKKSNRELQFENDHLTVWTALVTPETPLHLNQISHILIGLESGQLQHIDSLGHFKTVMIEPHQTYCLNYALLDPCHPPFHVMVIERKAPTHCLPPSQPLD